MDILTEKGQQSLRYERIMLKKIMKVCSGTIIETDKNMDAKVDGVISKSGKITNVFESKCRDMSLQELNRYGSWLITFDKIMDGKRLSEMLRVPYIGFLYLIKDDIAMYWEITDKYGNFLFDFEVKNTRTQKTINGGSIIRTNAYLPIEKGSELYE
jgi:hypothetical protein|tara:strand:+ start:161 stop:628 length:468 start_codon:yes stop_codon:yes gene_type:complete